MTSPYNPSSPPQPSPHSSLNQMEVRPRQILSLMLRVWSQFLPPKVPSTLAFALSLGICSGSGRQRLGSHSLAPTKHGIGLVLKMTPNPQLLRFQIIHYLKALSPLSIPNTHKLGSFQMAQLFSSVSSSIRSEQFLLTLNATEYGIFFTTFGGCEDLGLRYSCESVGSECISGLWYQETLAQFHYVQV